MRAQVSCFHLTAHNIYINITQYNPLIYYLLALQKKTYLQKKSVKVKYRKVLIEDSKIDNELSGKDVIINNIYAL